MLAALAAAGIDTELRTLAESTRTAVEAAAALGCEVGAIASSLVFTVEHPDGSTAPLLVMTSGAHRVDLDLVTDHLDRPGIRIRRATPDEVRHATGQAIGGVAPTGHPAPLETLVDSDLAGHDPIFAAAGTPHSIVALTFDQLVALTRGRVVQVAT